jgi:hypothetical protein
MIFGSGTAKNIGIQHFYGSNQDWSTKEFICLYFYGANTGLPWSLHLYAPDSNNRYRLPLAFTDNFTGWKRFVIPFNKFEAFGSPSLTTINTIRAYCTPTSTFINYLDRTVVDVGQWAKVEVNVPDTLAASGEKYRAYAWDKGASAYLTAPFLTDTNADNTQLKFLDQTLQSRILATGKGITVYAQGARGSNQTATGDTAAGSITYSMNFGTTQRIGFAIKLPPEDWQDSATAGISQCKLKLEVFYAALGTTTIVGLTPPPPPPTAPWTLIAGIIVAVVAVTAVGGYLAILLRKKP